MFFFLVFSFSKKQNFQANQLLWILKTQEYLINECELPMEKNLNILQKSIITFPGVEDEKSVKRIIEYFSERYLQCFVHQGCTIFPQAILFELFVSKLLFS